jgi:uncharacterized protein (TIGR00369 family)
MHNVESLEALFAPLLPGLLGIRLKEATPDRVLATLTVRSDLCTTGDTLHGGATMAFADTLGAIGTFQNLPAGSRTTTLDSTTKFIAAVPVGSTVIGECTPFHRGKTTMVWQTLIRSENGKLCAVVIQTQLILPGRPPSS